MRYLRGCLVWISFWAIILPVMAFANRETEINAALQKTEAQRLAYEYAQNLHQKISTEKETYEKAPKFWDGLSLHQAGSLKNETAYRIVGRKQWTKIKNQIILSEAGKFSDALRFKISGRAYYDLVYNVTHNYPGNVRANQGGEIELRDTYLDYSNGPWDIRMGKQQIVWGEAVALFFADVVNARDLREFVLPEFNLIRIPQTGIDLEYSKDKFHTEIVWLPVLEFDKLGVFGSDFAPLLPLPSTQTPFAIPQDPSVPKNSFNNSEAGLRLSYLLNEWDFSAFYLHTWNRQPVMYRTINSGIYVFSPSYKRLDVYGATFAKEIMDCILKGEFVFNRDDYFPIIDAGNDSGIVRRNVLNYLIGLDHKFFKKVDVNFQLMQRIIFDYPGMLFGEKESNTSFALWIRTSFFNNKIEPEYIFVTSLLELDTMHRPRVSIRLNDSCKLRFGADIFQGSSMGVFGRYKKKSRIYSEFTYNF